MVFLNWLMLAPLFAAFQASAQVPAPTKALRPARYDQAPPAISDFLLKARIADAISDPLQRCLRFPARPDSRWAEGLIKAHCEFTFSPRIKLDDVRAQVATGKADALEAMYRRLLERHFSEQDFSEDIHAAFFLFDASYEAGRASKDWLELAPASPFAMTARAQYFSNMGWTARGGAYSGATPAQNMQRMGEFHAQAAKLYEQALAIEPRLLHARIGLLNLANNGTTAAEKTALFEAGRTLDPGCKELAAERMLQLTPRWGGSYPQMLQLSAELKTLLARRPLLSLVMVKPYLDLADASYRAKDYAQAVKILETPLGEASSPQLDEDLAVAMHYANKKDDGWRELSYFVSATRFRPGRATVAELRGRRQLLLAWDPLLANASLKHAVAEDPDDKEAHYLLAASYFNSGQFLAAEPDYVIAMTDPDFRRDSLAELSKSLVAGKALGRARPYVDLLNKEYPAYAPGWLIRATAYSGGRSEIIRDAFEKFLATTDHGDPNNAALIANIKQNLAVISAGETKRPVP